MAPEMRAAPSALAGLAGAAWEALGTSAVLRVSDPASLETARAAVERELAAVDEACSRFRADSVLSRVNARAGRWTQASPLLIEALEVALRAAALSDGDVDPTVGGALELAGYDRDWRLLDPPRGEPEAFLAVTARIRAGWQAIELDRASASVKLPAGVKLDLGASAKAWAADRAAAAAERATGCGVLVSLGGDIATAGTAPAGGWLIRVTDDHRNDHAAPGQTVSIRSGGLATSSTAVRRWSHDGHTMHHIIDPATGAPVRDTWRTVSVAAASCTDANTAATAALVRAQAAAAWLDELGLPARLLDRDGNVTAVGEWPAETSTGALAA
ncbi:MAG: FAD:protein FMN transferase [Solirubrobacteraceae bacterium]